MRSRELDSPHMVNGSTPEAAYSLDNVGVTLPSAHGSVEILRGLNFEVARGEFVSIVGRSGSGKTTLLRLLSGLLPATTGQLRVNGVNCSGVPAGVVTVFQDYAQALLPWRTVTRNVELGLEGRFPSDVRKKRVGEALRMVRLEDRGGEYPWRLSGGMQQRVQIARALAMQAEILLMDEPFGSLDAMTKTQLQDDLLRLQERTGATILFVTHDIDEAIYLSDRVLVISGSPATMTLELASGLARPREQLATRAHPDFLAARAKVTEALA